MPRRGVKRSKGAQAKPADHRAHVSRERSERDNRCACPPWKPHSSDCLLGAFLLLKEGSVENASPKASGSGAASDPKNQGRSKSEERCESEGEGKSGDTTSK